MAYLLVHAWSLYTTQSSMAIFLFTVWVLTMIGVCQASSVLISFLVFWFLWVICPSYFQISKIVMDLSIFLHGYNNTYSGFIIFFCHNGD